MNHSWWIAVASVGYYVMVGAVVITLVQYGHAIIAGIVFLVALVGHPKFTERARPKEEDRTDRMTVLEEEEE